MDKLLEWKKKNLQVAGYAHFDKKFGLDSAWDYITDPSIVAKHSFFPFITYDQVFYKAHRESGKELDEATNKIIRIPKKERKIEIKDKVRPICYSAHIDRCIYQYYGYLLNEKYNEYLVKENISQSVVAYRTNLHKNNIDFAKQAFDFIKKGECNIIVGDFKGFFDNLDHKYLKRMLCEVLGQKTLSNDWYAVYKNVTKYSKWDLVDILKINGLITDADIKKKNDAHQEALKGNTRQARELIKYFDEKIDELNGFNITYPHKIYKKSELTKEQFEQQKLALLEIKKERTEKLALTKEQFKQHKKTSHENKSFVSNKQSFGIPQGSSISAVLSNVYMINFDKKIQRFVEKFNGLYLRYSDDFIIILPKDIYFTLDELKTYLHGVVYETDKLTLEAKKTQIYSFENSEIFNIVDAESPYKSQIDYLGFIFDGKQVTLRPKTISKYYYRMHKKLNHIVKSKGITKKGHNISYDELYNTYTQKGRNGQYDKDQLPNKIIKKDANNKYKIGNFFSYVQKADLIFNPEYVGKNKVNKPDKPLNDKMPITRSTQRHMLKIRRKRQDIVVK